MFWRGLPPQIGCGCMLFLVKNGADGATDCSLWGLGEAPELVNY